MSNRVTGLLAFILAALWTLFAKYGPEFIRSVLYDRIFDLVKSSTISGILIDFGPSIVMAGIGFWFFYNVGRKNLDPISMRFGKRVLVGRYKLDIYLIVASVAALVFVGAIIGYFITSNRGTIEWTFGTHISPFSTWMEKGKPLRVDGFNIQGKNLSDEAIHPKSAYVRSNINNRTIDLKFTNMGSGRYDVNEMDIMPGSFVLVGDIPSTDAHYVIGVTAEEVREQFGKFTFVFIYNDDVVYKRNFVKEEVDTILYKAERVNRDALEQSSTTKSDVNSGLIFRNPP